MKIIGGILLNSCQNHSGNEISEKQIADIKIAIKETALRHLNSENAISALGCYTKDATINSNGVVYSSFESFAEDIKELYRTLSKINLAAYDEMVVKVITDDVALLTAKFRWSATDTNGTTTDLQGIYSALYILEEDRWKMSWRHESFLPMKK